MCEAIKAVLAIDARDVIGEGPAWDARRGRLIWSDNEGGVVHAAAADGLGGWREVERWELGRPLAGAVPRASGGLAVGGGLEIFFLDDDGAVSSFVSVNADPARVRLNEIKCDPAGRLWAGTISTDFSPGAAALYRIDPDGSVMKMVEGITVSNGLDWSPDGRIFYYIDSLTMKVEAFDFDPDRGTIANRRTIVTVGYGEGGPDGMTVDREGCLWVAQVGSGAVQRYTPDGRPLERVEISTPAVTSCAFGGADGEDLFITCLGRRMPDVVLSLGISAETIENCGPTPGALFVCRPGPRGAPATPFAG